MNAIWQRWERKKSPVRTAVAFSLRASISVGLLYFALRHVDWQSLGLHLRNLRLGWVIVAFLAFVVQAALGAWRWTQVARLGDLPLSLIAAIRYSLFAGFLNQALPATVGGDAARIWFVARRLSRWADTAYSVLIDRSFGGIACALLVVTVSPWTFGYIHDPVIRATLLVSSVGLTTAFCAILLIGLLPNRWLTLWKPARHSGAVTGIVLRMAGQPRLGASVVTSSFLIHLLGVFVVWCLAQSVMVNLPSYAAIALVPAVLLVAMMPVSIAGWGLRESAMAAVLKYAGVGHSVGVLISILYGAGLFFLGLIGGLIWTLGRHEDSDGASTASTAAENLL